ncbi:MAG: hypothetical protein JWO96_103 [Candidatus Saccharibacteria bacterium]|nr:hypothetical protein [Candidatus Saccharibacteria bacterium]
MLKEGRRRASCALLTLLFLCLYIFSPVASAINADAIKALQTPFYDPNDSISCGSAAVGSVASQKNIDYAGRPILNQGMLKALAENQPVYVQAADAAGIPWQALAALHYREHSLIADSPNSDGAYQIVGGKYPVGNLTKEQFLAQSIDAANFIKQKEPDLTTSPAAATIKNAFALYNGLPALYKSQAVALGFKDSQGYEGSPYVMNIADARRDNSAVGANPNTWLQYRSASITAPATNDQYGAFMVYASLAGLAADGGACVASTCSNGPSNASQGLSQVRQNVVCLTLQELQKWDVHSGKLTPGSGYLTYSQDRHEDWCADFASWIYKQAGYPFGDGNAWGIPGVANIQALGEKDKNFHWHPVGTYGPQPGDLAIHGDNHGDYHVNLVTGVNGVHLTLIGGNQGGSSGFETSRVTTYTSSDLTDGGDITGFVSPE